MSQLVWLSPHYGSVRVSPEEAIIAHAPWRTQSIVCRRNGSLPRAASLLLVVLVVVEETLQFFIVVLLILLIFCSLFPACCGAQNRSLLNVEQQLSGGRVLTLRPETAGRPRAKLA